MAEEEGRAWTFWVPLSVRASWRKLAVVALELFAVVAFGDFSIRLGLAGIKLLNSLAARTLYLGPISPDSGPCISHVRKPVPTICHCNYRAPRRQLVSCPLALSLHTS